MKHRILQLIVFSLFLTPVLAFAASSTAPTSDRQGGEGTLDLHVTWNGINVVGAPVYLYTENGAYLDRCTTTDARGHVQFTIPISPHNFRVEYKGKEYWTGTFFAIADQKLDVVVPLEQWADESTNNPNSARYDGEPPIFNHEPVQVASLGTYIGILSQVSVAQIQQPKVYYFITDYLGTPIRMTYEAGAVVWSADYRPFGELAMSQATAENNFRFPGQYCDPETGLHYNYHRFYQPKMGRYMTPDPIGLLGGINPFYYVKNNPISNEDPFGLWWASGHSDLTSKAVHSFTGLLNSNDLARIIASNVGVDIMNPVENAAHYMPKTAPEAEGIIARYLNLAVRMELAGHHDWAMYFLGAGLHTVQDRFAHCEQNAGWADHLRGEKQPDDPLGHPVEYQEALQASIDYVSRFVKAVNIR